MSKYQEMPCKMCKHYVFTKQRKHFCKKCKEQITYRKDFADPNYYYVWLPKKCYLGVLFEAKK